MIDDRELFDRAVQRFAPADGSFERLITRRDRKQRNKRVTAGVVALLLAAVVIGAALRAIQTGPPVPVTPTPSPSASNGDISFVGSDVVDFSDDHSDFAILFAVDPTSGQERKILDTTCPSRPEVTTNCGQVGIGSVDWSPDGTRIAYTLFGSGPRPGSNDERTGIYVMGAETERVLQLTSCTRPCVYQDDLDWSPDGSRIAYAQSDLDSCAAPEADLNDGTCNGLYTMRSDGKDRVKLPTGSVVDPVDPSWSPDGGTVAFSGRVGEDWFVYTMVLDGSEPVRLAADLPSPRQTQPAWSPDGSTIAFVTWEGAAPGAKPTTLDGEHGLPFALWTMAPDGSERRRLYEGCCMLGGAGYGVQGPLWSPDGTQILLMEGTGGGLQLIDPETGENTEVPKSEPTGVIAWQPVPLGSSSDTGVVTFSFDFDDANHHYLYWNGLRVKGDMVNADPDSGIGYQFVPDRMSDVPAGALVFVEDNAEEVRAWFDACCDTSKPPRRLYELDLIGSASMPEEPGTYFVEFWVRWPDSEGGVATFLFPVRVVAPEGR